MAFGEARVEEICKPLSIAKKWHKGDTVYWKDRVAPAYRQIVESSKPHAIRNTTFKQSLNASGYPMDKINSHNSLRLQQECDVTNLNSSNTCHHFQAYCINNITTKTLNKSFDSFNNCAINRSPYCGESFSTPEGILGNLRELEKASEAILDVQDDIRKDPNLNAYFGDVEKSFDELKSKLALAKENAKQAAENLEDEIEQEYSRLKTEDDRFNNCCSILDQCDDYLKKEGYEDNYSLLSQTTFCKFNSQHSDDELKPLENLLKGLNGHNEKENLKELAIKSLENATKQTVKEYASTYKALHGVKPSSAQMCKDLPKFCQNTSAKNALADLNLSEVQKLDVRAEVKRYNQQALEMNKLCKQAKSGHVTKELEAKINQSLYQTMYTTRIGQLMGVKNFRDKVPPYNQQACFEDGEGFTPIAENESGDSLITAGITSLFDLQKDKSKKLVDQKNQVTYAGKFTDANDRDYYKILKDIVRNDPYMIQEVLRNSGNPDQALWVCKATHDLYKTEKWETIGTWVGTGLAIAGSLVATVFTFGAATPLLVGSLAMATSVGVYNLNKAYTAKHNAEQSISIQSGERVLASMQLPQIDGQVKAAYFEVGMSLLPGAVKGLQVAGKAIGPVLKSSQLLRALPAGAKLTGASKSLVDAVKSGHKVSQKMIQKALASKLPNASPDKIKHFASILEGTSADMSLEMIVFASSFPDPPGPFSKEGMQSLALALGTSAGFNSLGPAGKQWVLKRKATRNNQSIKIAQDKSPAIIIDNTTTINNTAKIANIEKNETYSFNDKSRHHVFEGDFSHMPVGKETVYKLKGGMHSDEALTTLINNNPDVKNSITDGNGNIKSEYLIEYPNGVREVLLPREAFQAKHWKSVKAAAERYNSNFYGELNGKQALGKTLFPKDWDEAKILDATMKLKSSKNGTYNDQLDVMEYKGTVDGVEILVVVDNAGEVRTAYPILESLR